MAAFNFENGLINSDWLSQNRINSIRAEVYKFDDNPTFDHIKLYRNDRGVEISFLFGYGTDNSGYFSNPPMLSLSSSKTLIVTDLDNSNYQVIERWATGPYNIDIKGFIVDVENHNFPKSKLHELHKIFKHNGIWQVASDVLNAVGVTSLYFSDVNIDFLAGYNDTIVYSLSAKEIKQIDYQLN